MKIRPALKEKNANDFLKYRKSRGITLIAMVMTIIILIILSVITINAVVGEKGIINKAQNAGNIQKEAEEKDQIKVALLEYKVIKAVENANKDLAEFMEEQEFCTSASKNADNTVTVTMKSGNQYKVTEDGNIGKVGETKNKIELRESLELKLVTGIEVKETLTATLNGIEGEITWENSDNTKATISGTTGSSITVTAVALGETIITAKCGDNTATCKVIVYTDMSELKAGDFVNYTAGTWTQEEIDSLGSLYSGEALPTTGYKFGGFKAGSSKDASITPYNTFANQYSGWRVVSNTNGEIKIVHAGTPEGYYHPKATNSAYKSEYILNKDTTNSDITVAIKGVVSTTRDWSMYENSLARQGSAHCLTWSEISGFSTNDSLRKTDSYYWLACASSSGGLFSIFNDGSIYFNISNLCFGVRPVVSLRSDIQIVSGSGTDTAPYVLQ